MQTYQPRKRRLASAEEVKLFDRFWKTVGERIPAGAQDVVKERHPALKISRIQNVRTARTRDLALLVLIVGETLPTEPIPDYVTAFLTEHTEHTEQEGGQDE